MLFLCLLLIACNGKPPSVVNKSKLSYYVENYEFEKAQNMVVTGDFLKYDIPHIVNLYYQLMRLANSAYQNTLILYQLALEDYLSRPEELHPDLVPVAQYFLGRSYWLSGQEKRAKEYFSSVLVSYPGDHPLYARVKLLAVYPLDEGDQFSETSLSRAAYPARALGVASGNTVNFYPLRSTLESLDRAIVALNEGNFSDLDRAFESTLTPVFFYEAPVEDSLHVRFYAPEALLVAAIYFGHKAEEFSERLGKVEEDKALGMFYRGWVSVYAGQYEDAIKEFKNLLNSQILETRNENSISAIVHGLSQTGKFDQMYVFEGIDPDDYDRLIPAAKYWFYKHQVGKDRLLADEFFLNVDGYFASSLTREIIEIPEGINECDFREILFTVGRYFVLTLRIEMAEKYFAAIHNLTKSFDLSSNPNCGLMSDYHPAVNLSFSATAMIHRSRLNKLALDSISRESSDNTLYLEPAVILKWIQKKAPPLKKRPKRDQ